MSDTKSIERANLNTESSTEIETASTPFVGQWNGLISRTNWEKGRIICQWRDALVAEGADASDYSDDAWAKQVGGVSGQHVGRLRRVFLRYGDKYTDYQGLYWSHFFAAIEWSDAEMWLEGSVQNKWSVSKMRGKRWETLGAAEELKPDDADIVSSEANEDVENSLVAEVSEVDGGGDPIARAEAAEKNDLSETADDVHRETTADSAAGAEGSSENTSENASEPTVRPFADLPELPEDLAEAFEQFKLAILAHKIDEWKETSCDDVLAALNALKSLALAPSGKNA